jgi:hypothetical protein
MEKERERKDDAEPITEEDLLVYGAYGRIAYSLRHSNNVQLMYKLITFTLFLATLIGVGYLVSSREIDLPFPPLLIVPIVCIFSLLIIFIIWKLDLIVEEKKIASAVHRGIKTEKKHSGLPGPYHNVVALQPLPGYITLKTFFYLGWSFILVITMCGSISAFLYIKELEYWMLVLFAPIFIMLSFFWLAKYIIKKQDPYSILDKIDSLEK